MLMATSHQLRQSRPQGTGRHTVGRRLCGAAPGSLRSAQCGVQSLARSPATHVSLVQVCIPWRPWSMGVIKASALCAVGR